MKIVILILAVLAGLGGRGACERQDIVIPELSGVVKDVAWRSGFKMTRFAEYPDCPPGPHDMTFWFHDNWIVVLKDVKGIDAQTAEVMGVAFSMREPRDAVYESYTRTGDEVLIWLGGGKDLRIRKGCRLVLRDVKYDDYVWYPAIDPKTIEVKPGPEAGAEAAPQEVVPKDGQAQGKCLDSRIRVDAIDSVRTRMSIREFILALGLCQPDTRKEDFLGHVVSTGTVGTDRHYELSGGGGVRFTARIGPGDPKPEAVESLDRIVTDFEYSVGGVPRAYHLGEDGKYVLVNSGRTSKTTAGGGPQ